MLKFDRHLNTMFIIQVDNGFLVSTSRLNRTEGEFGLQERQFVFDDLAGVLQQVGAFFPQFPKEGEQDK